MGISEPFTVMLAKADIDLRTIRLMRDQFAFDDTVFGFHAQQACEKLLKAWLLRLGKPAPKTHDLRNLIALLAQAGVAVADEDAINELTDFAVEWRYDEFPPDGPIDRLAVVELVEQLRAALV